MRTELQGRHALAEVVTFKGIVAIQILQTPIFTGIAKHGEFTHTANVSTFDFTVSTSAFLTCYEMFIVSTLFLWSYSAKPYQRPDAKTRGSRIGRAIIDVVDIRDIHKGCFYMVKIIFTGQMRREAPTVNKEYYEDQSSAAAPEYYRQNGHN